MAKKLWGGRFTKGLDEDAVELSYSLHWDNRLALYDIAVNKAHVAALAKAGFLTAEEKEKLVQTLNDLAKESETNEDLFTGPDEDIHSCIERLVTERCGDLGKRMHTGKSRNDQVITDVKLFTKDAVSELISESQVLISTLYEKAREYDGQIFPGFTHFQPAQPVLFSHYLLAYAEQFFRDITRFEQVLAQADICPLGSGAMAGNNYGLDRDAVAKELGFSSITNNSMDAVSDRDFILDCLSAASICMTHLSRFCEEIVVFASPLIDFFHIGDDFTTGSSIMPQKKNPDVAELIRGKMGRVQGHFVALQTTVKGLPLTYNRDLQEDKLYLFDAVDTVGLSLRCFSKMLASIRLNTEAINEALKKGYLTATDFADYLVIKGVPFREAHEITGKVVLFAIEENCELHELSLAQFQSFSDKIEGDVFDAISIEAAVKAKEIKGGTGNNSVSDALEQLKRRITWKKH